MPFIPLDYQKMQRNIVKYSHILVAIWQFYIHTILDCLQSKKYCEAIMDDLLLFMPLKRSHMNKLEDLLKALLKNGLTISPKKC